MKLVTILIIMTTNFAYANKTYKVPSEYSHSGYIKVENTSKGVVIHFPKEVVAKEYPMPSNSTWVNENMCSSYYRDVIEDINNMEDSEVRAIEIQEELYVDGESSTQINYFPFNFDELYENIRNTLSQDGVSVNRYRYRQGQTSVKDVRLEFSNNSLSTKIKDIKAEEEYSRNDLTRNDRVIISTNYIPLACDLIQGNVKIHVDWELKAEPTSREYKELLSEQQVVNVYKSVNNLQNLLQTDQVINSDLNTRSFIQGALFGSSFNRYVGELNSGNIYVFKNFFHKVFNSRAELVDMSGDELEMVYYNLQVDVTENIHFRGVSYAK